MNPADLAARLNLLVPLFAPWAAQVEGDHIHLTDRFGRDWFTADGDTDLNHAASNLQSDARYFAPSPPLPEFHP